MKFSTREDIEAPIDYVFTRITDFQGFERQAMRRGANLQRLDNTPVPALGSAWDISFKFRGRDRKINAVIAKLEAPTDMRIDTTAKGLGGVTLVELVALSRTRTRISMTLEMTPKTLAARLLMQSLKLAKTNLIRRFKLRVSEFSEGVEDSYRKQV
jgi:carbon monoxide dehydrogenase subunit G